MIIQNKTNITMIGWWTWTYNVLSWLKKNRELNLAAIVSMSDSWWSTWLLRDEFWTLPPWDIRRAVLALSEESLLLRKLFEYRFDKESSVSGHTVWNLLLTAMNDITWDFQKWLDEVSRLFRVRWKVVPVTLETSDLVVELEDWTIVKGETNIDCPVHNPNLCIKTAYLEPEVKVNPRWKETLESSDIIIIWPGDLYTSIIPNLLVKWVAKSIKRAKKHNNAKIVYFCNIMTKSWETTNFEVIDFVNEIEKYLWTWILDYVVVNNWHISDYMVAKYKKEENKKPVKIKDKDLDNFKDKKYNIIQRDLINEKDFVRHSPVKMAWVINDIIDWWIK